MTIEEPKPKNKGGRKPELDRVLSNGQTVADRILELVRAGASYPAAAQSCGLPQGTWENYQLENYGGERIQRFRRELKAALGDQRMAEEMSISRAHRGVPIRTTKTVRKPRMVGKLLVRDEATGDIIYDEEVTVTDSTKVYWQAAAWMLERKKSTRAEYPRPAGSLYDNPDRQPEVPEGVPEEATVALDEAWGRYMRLATAAQGEQAEPVAAEVLPESNGRKS